MPRQRDVRNDIFPIIPDIAMIRHIRLHRSFATEARGRGCRSCRVAAELPARRDPRAAAAAKQRGGAIVGARRRAACTGRRGVVTTRNTVRNQDGEDVLVYTPVRLIRGRDYQDQNLGAERPR